LTCPHAAPTLQNDDFRTSQLGLALRAEREPAPALS